MKPFLKCTLVLFWVFLFISFASAQSVNLFAKEDEAKMFANGYQAIDPS